MKENIKSTEYNEDKLRKYVKRCFIDAFKKESREYKDDQWSFEWIMIRNKSGMYQLYPFMRCKFERVLLHVRRRLIKNLMKNFNIHYGNSEELRCDFYRDGQVDYNFTQAMIKIKFNNGAERIRSISIFDSYTNPHENDQSGECITAYTYEKLLFEYWNLDAESYNALPENDKKRHLPESMRNWDSFKELYNRAFGEPIGSRYDIICSSGITRIE